MDSWAVTITAAIISFSGIVVTAIMKLTPSREQVVECVEPQSCLDTFKELETASDALSLLTGEHEQKIHNIDRNVDKIERRQDSLNRAMYDKIDSLTATMNKGFHDLLLEIKK